MTIGLILYYLLQVIMGANCTKPMINPSHRQSTEYSDRMIHEHLPKPSNSQYFFQVKINNVCLSTQKQNYYDIIFQFDSSTEAVFMSSEMGSNGKLKLWNIQKQCKIKLSEHDLVSLNLKIKVRETMQQKTALLKLKFGQLCRGPIHHDHLLPEIKSRIIFDIEIDERIDTKIQLENFNFKPAFHNCQKLKISSDLIYSSTKNDLSEIKPQNDSGPIKLTYRLYSNELKDSSLRLRIWDQTDIQAQIYLTYQQFLISCQSYKTQRKNNSNFMKRSLNMKQKLRKQTEIDYRAPENKNQFNSPTFNRFIEFKLSWEVTETFVEQPQGVIWSEKGINTVSPHMLKGEGSTFFQKSSNIQLNYNQLKELLKQLKNLNVHKNNGRQQKILLEKTYNSLIKGSIDFSLDDETPTIQYQFLLIDLLEQISGLIEEGQYMINQNIWKIFNVIIRRAELSIRYLHAIDDIKDKKKIGVKFYKFVCFILVIIVRSTGIGFSFNELKYSQKFIAYSFFRYPWFQNYFIRHLCKSTDPLLNNQRLAQIGVCGVVKSPSKNMVFDWEGNLYNFIRKQPQFMQAQQKLMETMQSFPEWSDILFNHDDEEMYFGGLSELLNEAEMTLNYQGKILWEYFPSYEKIIGRFEAQMKNNQPDGFTCYFQQFALKLMRNQRLLNTFMKFVFSKTFLYQTYSVMRCVEILRLIFEMLSAKCNRKLPTNFNCNLFYRGIVSILQINHSYLVIKTLNLLFLYYDMLSIQCQNNIDEFIYGPIFFKLFLHWYYLSRKMFMCFLLKHVVVKYESQQYQKNREFQQENYGIKFKRLMKKLHDKQKQVNAENSKIIKKGVKHQYFVRMKNKLQNLKRQKKQKSRYDFFEPSLQKDMMRSSLDPFLNKNLIEENQIRPRKWSSHINTDSEQLPQGSQHYLKDALTQYQTLSSPKVDLDEQAQKIISIFSVKRKVDEKQ